MDSKQKNKKFDKTFFIEHLARLPHVVVDQMNKGNVDHLAHDLLESMCLEGGLPLSCAAFIVDNKDFRCSAGVAAFHRDEKQYQNHKKKVNTYQSCALGEDGIAACAKELGFNDYGVCIIPLKNGNEGIFVYENNEAMQNKDVLAVLPYALALLALCPLF